jgi:hypothetical protein
MGSFATATEHLCNHGKHLPHLITSRRKNGVTQGDRFGYTAADLNPVICRLNLDRTSAMLAFWFFDHWEVLMVLRQRSKPYMCSARPLEDMNSISFKSLPRSLLVLLRYMHAYLRVNTITIRSSYDYRSF